MTVLAHVAGFHIVLYLSPVFLVGGGLWLAGRHVSEDEDFEWDDDEHERTTGEP